MFEIDFKPLMIYLSREILQFSCLRLCLIFCYLVIKQMRVKGSSKHVQSISEFNIFLKIDLKLE